MSSSRVMTRNFRTFVSLWFIALAVVFATGCGHTSKTTFVEKDNRERWGLHGDVKTCTLYTVLPLERLGRVFEAGSDPDSSNSFSTNGNRVDSIYYDSLGNPVMDERLTYDSDVLTNCVRYKYNDDGSGTTKTGGYTIIYNNQDNIDYIRGYYYSQEQERVDWLHLYGYGDGSLQTVISGFQDTDTNFSALQWKHIHKYRNNRLTEVDHYNADGSIEWIDKFKYDSKGNKTEWARFVSGNRLVWIDSFKYDDNENEIECTRNDSDGHRVYKYVYRYVTIPTIEAYDGQIPDSLFLSKGYNPNQPGNAADSFDQAGNWTVKVTLEENTDFGYTFFKVNAIQKREISYYGLN
jgi:hypothetical protein